MNLIERRSPEVVREYFSLLDWKKKGCPITEESIRGHEKLQILENILISINQKIFLIQTSLSNHVSSANVAKVSIESTNREVAANQREIHIVEEEIANLREKKTRLETQEETTTEKNRQTNLKEPNPELIRTLFLGLFANLKDDFLKILMYLKKRSINVLASLILFFIAFWLLNSLVRIVFSLGFGYLYILVTLISAILYFSQKTRLITRINKQKIQDYLTNIKVLQDQKSRDIHKTKLQKRLLLLVENLEILRTHERRLFLYQRQALQVQRDTEISIREGRRNLSVLENHKQSKTWEHQHTREILIAQQREVKESRLKHLEIMAEEWLCSDMKRFTHRAMKKLNILDPSSTGELNALKGEPLRILVGTTERTSKSLIIESDSDYSLEKFDSEDLLINDKDLRSELMFNFSSVRRYGVYEFLVIFLCANFLTYYKCHLNFVQGKAINEEMCEYLYDSIVSVGMQEKSSTRTDDGEDKEKKTYAKRLLLTTKDGKVVSFRAERSKMVSIHSLTLSQIDEAVVAIRSMLRQRRIDKTYTQELNN